MNIREILFSEFVRTHDCNAFKGNSMAYVYLSFGYIKVTAYWKGVAQHTDTFGGRDIVPQRFDIARLAGFQAIAKFRYDSDDRMSECRPMGVHAFFMGSRMRHPEVEVNLTFKFERKDLKDEAIINQLDDMAREYSKVDEYIKDLRKHRVASKSTPIVFNQKPSGPDCIVIDWNLDFVCKQNEMFISYFKSDVNDEYARRCRHICDSLDLDSSRNEGERIVKRLHFEELVRPYAAVMDVSNLKFV